MRQWAILSTLLVTGLAGCASPGPALSPPKHHSATARETVPVAPLCKPYTLHVTTDSGKTKLIPGRACKNSQGKWVFHSSHKN